MKDLKIFIADNVAKEGLFYLEKNQIEYTLKTGLSEDELAEAIRGYHGLVVRSGAKVTNRVIEAADSLRVIGRAGIGVDNIDIESATKRGILVMNTPSANTITTAEHTVAMILSLARKIPFAHCALKNGRWEKKQNVGIELRGKVAGIIGVGKIGKVVAELLKGMGLEVIAYDPFVTQESISRLGVELVSLKELLSRSDIVTVHTPLTKDTEKLLNRERLGLMKDGALVVNCARGGIIDEEALLFWLDRGKIAGAAIDVYTKEPPPEDHPFLKHPKIVCTPHLGASTKEAQIKVAVDIFKQIVEYLKDGKITNGVNAAAISPQEEKELRPYIRLMEKMGSFQAQMLPARLKRIEIRFLGKIAELNVEPCSMSFLAGYLNVFSDTRVNIISAPIIAKEKGIQFSISKDTNSKDFISSIETICYCEGDRKRVIKGALFGINDPRIVGIDEYNLDVVPSGWMLVVHNYDRPGVVGRIGTILGDAGVNIAQMQLGLNRETKTAIAVYNLDSEPSEDALSAIESLSNTISVKLIKL